jgi:hypothetical protein
MFTACKNGCSKIWPYYDCDYICVSVIEGINSHREPCFDLGYCLSQDAIEQIKLEKQHQQEEQHHIPLYDEPPER